MKSEQIVGTISFLYSGVILPQTTTPFSSLGLHLVTRFHTRRAPLSHSCSISSHGDGGRQTGQSGIGIGISATTIVLGGGEHGPHCCIVRSTPQNGSVHEQQSSAGNLIVVCVHGSSGMITSSQHSVGPSQ